MSIIPFIIAAIFLSIAISSKRSADFKAGNWVTVKGKVVEIKSYWTNRKHYAPFIAFHTIENQQFYLNGKGSQKCFHQKGQIVEVVYNPQNPNQAEIKYDPGDKDMRTMRFMIGGFFLFFAFIFLVIDLFLLFTMIYTIIVGKVSH